MKRLLRYSTPPIQGLGTTGGFKLQIEDRATKALIPFCGLQATIAKAVDTLR